MGQECEPGVAACRQLLTPSCSVRLGPIFQPLEPQFSHVQKEVVSMMPGTQESSVNVRYLG